MGLPVPWVLNDFPAPWVAKDLPRRRFQMPSATSCQVRPDALRRRVTLRNGLISNICQHF